jgi:hypothetical protein
VTGPRRPPPSQIAGSFLLLRRCVAATCGRSARCNGGECCGNPQSRPG